MRVVLSGKRFPQSLLSHVKCPFLEILQMHIMNFKELSGQELSKLVDEGIETKLNPKKVSKTLEEKSLP